MTTPLERALGTLVEIRKRTEGAGSVWGSREILKNAEEDLHQALDATYRALDATYRTSHDLHAKADDLEALVRKLRKIADGMLAPPPATMGLVRTERAKETR
jgi:hypothetical protein